LGKAVKNREPGNGLVTIVILDKFAKLAQYFRKFIGFLLKKVKEQTKVKKYFPNQNITKVHQGYIPIHSTIILLFFISP